MEDWFENLSKEEIEEREEIEIGLVQAENNEFIEHEEVMKVFLKYKPRKENKL
ncbi:hypothetical protein [Flavobacterium sp. YJ01]|uniref:hypothetical protein n=1 Tax=unclassified Flavobacterium TaxID=196869 RepID=UPI0023E391D3|nr:hypothetical protein [Flavobacterium sp. YJ01]WET04701.1 hypothetical protein P0R33_10260 [Flavobacterium sp. YJ01]